MAIDLKITQNTSGSFDISFENGDFKSIDDLESALLMSIYYKQRASEDLVQVPQYRQGHFTDLFNTDTNYQVGSLAWYFSEQRKITEQNTSLLEDTIKNDGLQWLIDDNIVDDVSVEATISNSQITLNIALKPKNEQNSKYYQLFLHTFN